MGAGATAHAAPQQPSSEPVVIIDLRRGSAATADSRDQLAAALGHISGIRVKRSASLDAALAGTTFDPLRARAKEALSGAATAYGKLRCGPASTRAAEAAAALSALQARGNADQSPANGTRAKKVRAELERAYTYQLLCADSAGQSDLALRIANRLRALRGPSGADSPPANVSPAIWKRYPAIDAATNVLMLKVKVESDPGGAVVYVDHRRVGVTPVELTLSTGSHGFALAAPGRRAWAAELTIDKDTTISRKLATRPVVPRHDEIRRRVAAWRAGSASATGLAHLMRSLGVRFAVIMAGRSVQVWGVQKHSKAARRLGRARASSTVELGNLVLEHARAWDGRAPDPSLPLLREDRTAQKTKRPQKWWVYASILGAVVVGTAIIAAQDLAEDHQRFQLVFP